MSRFLDILEGHCILELLFNLALLLYQDLQMMTGQVIPWIVKKHNIVTRS